MKRFKLGDRVRQCCVFGGAAPCGATGTVALVAGVRGQSIYCDPSRIMVFVQWDSGVGAGEFKRYLEKISA